MVRPPKNKTMNREKAELISDALWEQLKFVFSAEELLDKREVHQLKPYERELYAALTDGFIILVEIMDDGQIVCSKLDPPEPKR